MAEKGMGQKPQALLDMIGTAKTANGKLLTEASIHGHHIVMKTIPAGPRGWYVSRSQTILKNFDIELHLTQEALEEASGKSEIYNLCYALNYYKDIHELPYVKAVWTRLNDAAKKGKGDFDYTQTLLKQECEKWQKHSRKEANFGKRVTR